MTSHELARKLLNGPDVSVLIQLNAEDGETFADIKKPHQTCARKGTWDHADLWETFPASSVALTPLGCIPVITLNP